jgi:Coenzyme F390 synthetase
LLEPECECGRCTTRISRMIGRADDMIIVRGINVFPTQVQDVISKIPEVTNQFQIVLTRNSKNLDEMTVQVELEKDAFTDDILKLEKVQQRVVNELMNVLSIRTGVELLEFGSIERTGGKAKRVIDNRKEI